MIWFKEKMDRFIDDYSQTNNNSGCLRVTLKDEIIYEKAIGFADRENKVHFNKNSVFSLYSLSKPFCTIGLLKLKDKGLVDIDRHPGDYLPEAKDFDGALTIRHMLHHVSGLPDFVLTAKFNEKYPSGKPCEIRGQLSELTKTPMVFVPGTDEMYNNTNFIISALIIENVSGMSYAEYMKKEVFEPLGMKNAQVDSEGLIVDNRVTGYVLQKNGIQPVSSSLDWMMGAGDIIATVDDVYCLNKAIKHQSLLKSETWQEVLTPSSVGSMGMGCRVCTMFNKDCIMHNGGSRGFRALHVQVPGDDLDIIYLSNSGWGEARSHYNDAVFEAFYGGEDSAGKIEMDKGYI